jgi:hypothetical protein
MRAIARRMKWASYFACFGEIRNTHISFFREVNDKRSLKTAMCTSKDNIKMHVEQI